MIKCGDLFQMVHEPLKNPTLVEVIRCSEEEVVFRLFAVGEEKQFEGQLPLEEFKHSLAEKEMMKLNTPEQTKEAAESVLAFLKRIRIGLEELLIVPSFEKWEFEVIHHHLRSFGQLEEKVSTFKWNEGQIHKRVRGLTNQIASQWTVANQFLFHSFHEQLVELATLPTHPSFDPTQKGMITNQRILIQFLINGLLLTSAQIE